MYTYNAKIVSVYDGDTVTVDIDLGFRFSARSLKIRMYGINAPEIKGPTNAQGIAARNALREQILGKDVILHTIKDTQEKYGRWLGIIVVDGRNINDWMVDNGFAQPFMLDIS